MSPNTVIAAHCPVGVHPLAAIVVPATRRPCPCPVSAALRRRRQRLRRRRPRDRHPSRFQVHRESNHQQCDAELAELQHFQGRHGAVRAARQDRGGAESDLPGRSGSIFGALHANGRVFLINQNGIIFGPRRR